MMKMEIEQHIANTPTSEDCTAARDAVRIISEILVLLEELPDDKDLIPEISDLIDEIVY